MFDLFFSAAALILTAPLFLLIAAAIKSEDGGKVFFVHERIVKSNRPVRVLKFRSMKTASDDPRYSLTADQYSQYCREYKLRNDPRETKVGGFLRRSSLDELPQLVNILLGSMSFVGPRPIVREELSFYSEAEREKLFSVMSGLTGYWQAYARNKATYESGERQRMELYYADHASAALDIKILAKTVLVIAREWFLLVSGAQRR